MDVTRTPRSPLRELGLWAPPIALMAVIFALSAQPDLNSGLGELDLFLRKGAHMTEYGLLVFLWWRALRERTGARAAVGLAVVIALAYSGTDEYHQTFIHGRHGTPVDMAIDSVGMAVMALVLLLRRPR
jgi:VanZ family protein